MLGGNVAEAAEDEKGAPSSPASPTQVLPENKPPPAKRRQLLEVPEQNPEQLQAVGVRVSGKGKSAGLSRTEVAVEMNTLIQSQSQALTGEEPQFGANGPLSSGSGGGLPLQQAEEGNKDKDLDIIKSMIDKEFGNSLGSALSARVRKETSDLIKKISFLQNTNALIAKIKEEIETLKRGNVPTTCKKVNIIFDSDLMDSTMLATPFHFGPADDTMGDEVRRIQTLLHTHSFACQGYQESLGSDSGALFSCSTGRDWKSC